MKRILVVDMDNDYSNEEIRIIQTNLKKKTNQIQVYKEVLTNGRIVLYALSDIIFSYKTVINMIGEAYIKGVSG